VQAQAPVEQNHARFEPCELESWSRKILTTLSIENTKNSCPYLLKFFIVVTESNDIYRKVDARNLH